jgi:hypothetical protein
VRKRLIEHGAGIALVGAILAIFSTAVIRREEGTRERERALLAPFLSIPLVDLGNPLHVAMLKETLRRRTPANPERADSLLGAVLDYRRRLFTDPLLKSGGGRRALSGPLLLKLAVMYGEFLLVFAMAMVLSYFGARSLAVYRFVSRKRGRQGTLERLGTLFDRLREEGGVGQRLRAMSGLAGVLVRGAGRVLVGCILFAPGFVVAYAIRTKIDTSSSFALVALAVMTNGLLINSANRLYTLLVAESRKGYVLTAIVKNLTSSYHPGTPGGIGWSAILHPRRLEASHVFHHIYLNARYQYVPAIKEHAAFLVTGLIIIEMALNIQNHLGYELLQAILFRDVAMVALIVFGIYLLVKATEVLVDVWFHIVSRRYENAA